MSFYRHGDFEDLCRGGHLGSTKDLGAFKLLNTAGAYWRGDETRPMLQRIYGTAWDTQEQLDQHLWRIEEAKKRDHRKLGRELDLFTFHPESPAAPFLHPRGMELWRSLEDWSRQVRREAGFQRGANPEPRPQGAVGDVGPLEQLPGQHVRPGRPRPRLRAEADELPGGDPHLPHQGAVVSRPADALQRLLGPVPQGAHRRAGRHVPRPAADPGRLARLLPRRPGRRRDPPGALARPQAVRAVRLRAAREARHAPGEAPRVGRVLGARREPPPRAAGGGRHGLHPRSGRRRVLRPEDRHLHRGRPRSRVADGDDPGRLPAAAALRPRVPHPPKAASSARSSSTTRSMARSSASSASSPSTTPAPSRSGWPRCR